MRWLLNTRLWLAFFLILALTLPVQADGPGPYKIYLPVIGAGCNMTTLATLQISDGEVTVDLLRGRIHLADWNPTIPQLKAGGVWQDSALATGRRMVDRRFGNVSDSLSLVVSSPNQNDTIGEAGDLMHLLEKARDYTASGWQTDPVWIKRQAGCETNPTYALVFDYKIPNLSNPYAAPFAAATKLATLDKFSLSLEHSIWLSNPPGVGTCVQASSSQVWQSGAAFVVNSTDPTLIVYGLFEAADGTIYASDSGQILQSADGGTTWGVATALPTTPTYRFIQLTNGNILVGGDGELWQYDGANWTDIAAAGMTGSISSLAQTPTGRIVAAVGIDGVWVSDDNGSNWTQTLPSPNPAVGGLDSVIVANDGSVIAAGMKLFRSTNNGTTWYTPATLSWSMNYLTKAPNGNIYLASVYAGDEAVWKSTNNGAAWTRMPITFPDTPLGGYIASNTEIYYNDADGNINETVDGGATWHVIFTYPGGAQGFYSMLRTSADRLLLGTNGAIWEQNAGLGIDLGQEETTTGTATGATCEDQVYLANKHNVANLTNIYINDGGAWSANLFPFTFPGTTSLLPAAPAIGDAVYFGIDTSVTNSGPFESLVFDLSSIITYTTSYTILWEYYNGAAWTTLPAQDGTNPGSLGVFLQPGVSSVHWAPPTNWTTRALNLDGGPAVTGWWVRARVSALVGSMTAPAQQNRNIYTIVLPYANIAAAQVPGDIPALAEIKLHNRSDKDGRAGSAPDLWDNRVVIGLRSYDRGPTFSAFLNASDIQNPVGVTVTDGANTDVTVPTAESITGHGAIYTGPGSTAWTDEIIFTLGPTIARDYYGSYHAFLRATLDESGSSGDVHARLQVRTGSGGVTLTSAEDYLKGTDYFEVLDFGRVGIPASGILSFDDLGDSTQLVVQLHDIAPGGLESLIYDLILIPVDEVALDAVDYANIAASVVGRQSSTPHLVDFDSLTYQKVDVRSIVRTADGNGFVSSIYVPSGGPAFLQANAHQRLWVFAMQTDDVGADPVWLAPAWIAHSIQVFANSRWLGLRGDR